MRKHNCRVELSGSAELKFVVFRVVCVRVARCASEMRPVKESKIDRVTPEYSVGMWVSLKRGDQKLYQVDRLNEPSPALNFKDMELVEGLD